MATTEDPKWPPARTSNWPLTLRKWVSAPSGAHPDPGDGHTEDGASDLAPPADQSEGLI
jgi:hypothetical protein